MQDNAQSARWKIVVCLPVLLFLVTLTAQAQSTGGGMAPSAGVPSTQMSANLKDVGIDQKLNSQVPLDLQFHDEAGQSVALQRYFNGRPVILSLVYFNCPMLCPEVVSGMTHTLNLVKLGLGTDYDVLTVSFDPRDTPQAASEKKREWLRPIDSVAAQRSWHFLTGDQDSIAKLTQAVGFRYNWDPKAQQFAHATAIMVLTPEGKVSKYFYGVDYSPTDLRFGLIQASHNKIGSAVDQILLFCCSYDVTSGKYNLIISRVLSIAGAVTILILGTFLYLMFRLGPKRRQKNSRAAA